jgi:hypothetical protein
MSRFCSALVGCVAACAAWMSMASVAVADDPPDLSLSTLACRPENAVPPLLGSTRPGDFVLCQLKAANVSPTIAYHVTADISVPAGTTFHPLPNAQGTPVPAVDPDHVHFDETKLGLIDSQSPKPASIRLRILDGTAPGTPIQPVATVRDPAATTFLATANALSVMPQQADLTPTTTSCANADPARADVRAGDTLACTFTLTNKPSREDATDVTLTAGVPTGTEWAPGGNESFHFGSNLNWFADRLPGGVPTGTTVAPLKVMLKVLPTTLGGTTLYVNGTVNWVNALSGVPDALGVGSGAIVITPAPAVLTTSTLACGDDDGPPLLPNDLVNCTVAIRPSAGYEDLADPRGSAAIPALTGAVTPADGSGRIPFVGLPATIAAGGLRTASFRLRVAAGAAPGNVIVATATVTGRSTPSDTPITHALRAAPLVVGTRPAAAAPKPAPARPGTVAAATTPGTSRGPVICGSRRTVTINVRPPEGKRWKSVTFAFSTKSVKGGKAKGTRGKKGYFAAKLVFQGLPKGPLKVSIKGVTTRGRTVRGARTYNLCAKKK